MDDVQVSINRLGARRGRDPLFICLQCGNEAPHEVLGRAQKYITGSDGDVHHSPVDYYFTRCSTCEELAVFTVFEGEAIAQWPISSILGEGTPLTVEKYWNEALAVKGRSPNAFAVATRRALEEICEDCGMKGRTLAEKLGKLTQNLPDPMPEVAKVTRLLGNRGAHRGDDVSKDEAEVLGDFFLALIEHIYVAPFKLERYDRTLMALGAKPRIP